jgi:hypothetical protein
VVYEQGEPMALLNDPSAIVRLNTELEAVRSATVAHGEVPEGVSGLHADFEPRP